MTEDWIIWNPLVQLLWNSVFILSTVCRTFFNLHNISLQQVVQHEQEVTYEM